jgi:predicted dehydrogenase
VDEKRRAHAKKRIDDHYQWTGKGCDAYADFRELVARKDIDAVIIATPHFQHTTLGIAALNAGVHVMVEKPLLLLRYYTQ